MFTLQTQWDRPHKLTNQTSEHILRLRLTPQTGGNRRTLPLRMAIALDTSQSMHGDKLQAAKDACTTVIRQLRPQDRLSIAYFSTNVNTLLQNVTGDQSSDAENEIQNLRARGVTRTDLALNWIRSTLTPESGTVRVGILITDGHPTDSKGNLLENLESLIEQSSQLADSGIILCTVGLGNAHNFNTEFLVNLSDRANGAFIYADTPDLLSPQLQERLSACQTVIVEELQIKLYPMGAVKLEGFCQIHPEYLPLEETNKHQLVLTGLRSNTPTDVLIAVEVPPLNFGETVNTQNILRLEISGEGLTTIEETVSINYTNAYREAQQIDEEVNRDRLYWVMNQCSTEITRTQDPNKTGELLVDLQVAALKSGRVQIANQAAQQLEELQKNGQLDPHNRTKLLQTTRKMEGNQ